jgi:hypothetical protein
MTRAHVRLLGPCFKTGQADHACFRLQSEQSQINLADSSYRQRATVTRPLIISNQLAKFTDRVKRQLVDMNDLNSTRKLGLKPQGFADTQHLEYY